MLCFQARQRQRQPTPSPSRYLRHPPIASYVLSMYCFLLPPFLPSPSLPSPSLLPPSILPPSSLLPPPPSLLPPPSSSSLSPHRHIETSLGSLSTQINFFIHNLAQFKFQATSSAPTLLSFCPQSYSIATDGKIESAIITAFHKRFYPETYYVSECVCVWVCV